MLVQILLFFGVFLSVTASGLFALISFDRHRQTRALRLRRATDAAFQQARPARAPVPGVALATPASRGSGLIARLEAGLARSGLSVRPGELIGIAAVMTVLLWAGLIVLFGAPPVLLVLLAPLVAGAGIAFVVRVAQARRLAAFTDGLPEALDIFARGLKAGRPVADSLALVVANTTGPIAAEMDRCLGHLRIGRSLYETFARLAEHVRTPEVRFFATAVALQAETGGNLVETIENLAAQLRERRKLKKKIRALSAEARASAFVLGALPFVVGGAILVLNAGYLQPLVFDPRGRVMALLGLVGILAGVLMIVRMGKLDV